MRLSLVAKPLVLLATLLFVQSCHAFVISCNYVEIHHMHTRTSLSLGQCMARCKNYQQLFPVNASDQHGADTSGSSTTHRIFSRRRFSILKYPGVVLKYLRQHIGSRKLGRTTDTKLLRLNTEIIASDMVVDSETTNSSSISSNMMDSRLIYATTSMDRWAYSAPHVNLTGSWDLIASDDFLKEYDVYLLNLGQPYIVRSVAISIVDRTTEETLQTEGGRSLLLRSINARGVWERTLIASGLSPSNESSIVYATVLTADKEPVQAEAWWEENGTVHHSWLRGVTKYGGGDFESVRYLRDDDSILVCESMFHPYNRKRDPAHIQWRFRRRVDVNENY
jgi:hypothetical protein